MLSHFNFDCFSFKIIKKKLNFPVNMLDPFWKHSGYGHHCQHAARIGPDQVCQLWLPSPNLLPFCQKRSGSYCTKPAQYLDGLVRFCPTTSHPETSQCARIIWALPHFWQNTTGPLQASDFQTQLYSSTDDPGHTVQNQPWVQFGSGCVKLWPNG